MYIIHWNAIELCNKTIVTLTVNGHKCLSICLHHRRVIIFIFMLFFNKA